MSCAYKSNSNTFVTLSAVQLANADVFWEMFRVIRTSIWTTVRMLEYSL